MELLGIIFFIVVWLANSFFCGAVANSKGHDYIPWFFGGLFFGVFALIAVAGLDDKELKSYIRKIHQIEDKVQNLNNKENDDWEVLEDEEMISEDERTIARSKLRALGIESFDDEKK